MKQHILEGAIERNGVKYLILKGINGRMENIKDMAFQLKGELPADEKVCFVAGFQEGEKASLVVFLTEPLIAEGLNAAKLVREAAKHIQGGGGGQPHFATAGGKNPEGILAAVDEIIKLVGEK